MGGSEHTRSNELGGTFGLWGLDAMDISAQPATKVRMRLQLDARNVATIGHHNTLFE